MAFKGNVDSRTRIRKSHSLGIAVVLGRSYVPTNVATFILVLVLKRNE
jgi:hypothetical protein